MSPQTLHAVRQWVIMLVLAALGFLVANQTQILNDLGVPEVWQPVIVVVLATAVRGIEGLRDAARNRSGDLIPSDVGYDTVQQAEAVLEADAVVQLEAAPPRDANTGITDPFATY